MNAQLKFEDRVHRTALPPTEEVRLTWLMQTVEHNRFLPEPDPQSIFVGDGDYRAIGVEFLGHFVRIGGLKPTDRVLDIGCGIGRMAVPLTQYLDRETALYEGIDPVKEGVQWCVQNITPHYPNFRFCQVDIAHELYNPGGAVPGSEVVLPFCASSFDFVTMVSVATHLPHAEIVAYAREAMRLLAPGGRLFLTVFLIAQADLENRETRLCFQPGPEPGSWTAIPEAPLAAIGFETSRVTEALEAAGLRVDLISLGHWRGIDSAHYQDVIVAGKPEDAA